MYCGKWHQGECRFMKTKCNIYNEIGHILRVCKSIFKEEKNKQKERMIYILTKVNKIASVKLLPLTVNNLNANSQSQSIDLILDSGTIDHSICNKNLFMRETYKEKPSYLEIGLGERILSKGIGSVLVLFVKRKRMSNHPCFYASLVLFCAVI